MNRTALVASIVAATFLTGITPAHAGNGKPFHGPWAGATAGYDNFSSGDDEEDSSADGIVYGATLGYDFNLGGFVIGAEGELTDSGVDASASDVLEAGDALTLSAGRDIYAGLRVGVPVSDTVLAYAKGGYTNQRFSATYTVDGDSETLSGNVDGWRIGGGIEVDLGQPFARLEYRYSSYGSFSETDLETGRHQIVATAGLRF